MDNVIGYIRGNKIYLLLGVMIIMGVVASFGGKGLYMYYAAMLILAGISVIKYEKITPIFALFPMWLVVCSFVNNVLDSHIVAFSLVLVSASSLFSSYEAFIIRGRVFYAICLILPILTLFNLYAYYAGINYVLELNWNMSELNFSGFTPHPMFLGAVNGASNVVLTYFLIKFRNEERGMLPIGCVLALLIASIYLSVIAASRSALGASLIAMCGIVYLFSESPGKLIKSGIAIVIIASIVMPLFDSVSGQMRMKADNEENQGNSRSLIWEQRIKEFKSSPVFGIGFATAYDMEKQEVVTGTVETGSGWLTILSETGLIGALFIFLMMKRSYVPIWELKDDRGVLVLFACVLIYFCLHSIFEGYLYTPGYSPCLFFWLLIGFFYEYNEYKYEVDDYEIQDEIENIQYDDEDDEEDEENDIDYFV